MEPWTPENLETINRAIEAALDPDNPGWEVAAVEAFRGLRRHDLAFEALNPTRFGTPAQTGPADPSAPSDPADGPAPAGDLMGFGKYRHRTAAEVVREDPNYLRWALANANLRDGTRAAITAALAEIDRG